MPASAEPAVDAVQPEVPAESGGEPKVEPTVEVNPEDIPDEQEVDETAKALITELGFDGTHQYLYRELLSGPIKRSFLIAVGQRVVDIEHSARLNAEKEAEEAKTAADLDAYLETPAGIAESMVGQRGFEVARQEAVRKMNVADSLTVKAKWEAVVSAIDHLAAAKQEETNP